jgi:hypothetical protein
LDGFGILVVIVNSFVGESADGLHELRGRVRVRGRAAGAIIGGNRENEISEDVSYVTLVSNQPA